MAHPKGSAGGGGRRAGGQLSEQQQFAAFMRDAQVPSRQENWGSKARGQGKRVGRMVTGAMSAAPTGVKSYPDFQRARGVTPKLWADLKVLPDEHKRVVIGALQAGWSEKRAFRLLDRFT